MKIRGTASHIYDKYQALARDASASGDRIAAENYLQHAEHYFRILAASAAQQGQNQQGQQPPHGGEHQPQHGHPGEQDGNGRGRYNGQRAFEGEFDDGDDYPQRPVRRVEPADEARTIAPVSGGPTTFEPLPERPAAPQPAPQSLRELVDAAGSGGAAADEAGAEEADGQRKPGRKKSAAKDQSDTAPAN